MREQGSRWHGHRARGARRAARGERAATVRVVGWKAHPPPAARRPPGGRGSGRDRLASMTRTESFLSRFFRLVKRDAVFLPDPAGVPAGREAEDLRGLG